MVNFNELDKPYFIGEIGINHNGDTQIAKRLVDAAFACQWDCVKFQKRNPDVCVPEHQKNKLRNTPWGRMSYLQYKYKVEFGKNEYDIIDEYSKQKPIDWTTSVWDLDSLEFMQQYKVPFLKIPSALITDDELISETAKTKIPLIISTGMSTLEEVDNAVNLIMKEGVNPVIMHCNSSYPTPKSELNLRVIETLKDRYDTTIGYSGHEEDLEPTVIAITLGAKVIERHITLSHDMWGTDQKASLEVIGMDMLRKRCMEVEDILGSPEKVVTESELPIREKLRVK